MRGSGSPLTGTRPATMAILYTTWKVKVAAMAAARNAPTRSRASRAVSIIRQITSRQVPELGLAPLLVAPAEEAPRAHRDLRLDLLIARALGVERGIEERVDP